MSTPIFQKTQPIAIFFLYIMEYKKGVFYDDSGYNCDAIVTTTSLHFPQGTKYKNMTELPRGDNDSDKASLRACYTKALTAAACLGCVQQVNNIKG